METKKTIKRSDFLPEDLKGSANLNEALPIGCGQTNSQPEVVAFMLKLLNPRPGNKILDVGSGSGWTTALLADIVGKRGKNYPGVDGIWRKKSVLTSGVRTI